MKILMLINWKIKYRDSELETEQKSDYYVKGEPYWFFRYFKEKPEVDVIDIRSFGIEQMQSILHSKLVDLIVRRKVESH